MSNDCTHLSRLDRVYGAVCTLCDNGGTLAAAEIASRYDAPNIAHGRRRRRTPRRGYSLPIASAVRGALRALAPWIIVAALIVVLGLVINFIENI